MRSTLTRPRRTLRVRSSHGTCATDFPMRAAITDLRRALSINPNLADAYVELGKVYLHIGQTDKAVEANDQATAAGPFGRAAGKPEGPALVDAGRLEEVRHELDRHSRLSPISRADALLAIGQLEEALQTLLPATSTESGDPESDIGVLPCWQWCTPDSAAERTLSAPWPQPSPSLKTRLGCHTCITRNFTLAARLAFSAGTTRPCAGSRRPPTRVTPSYPRFSTDQSLAPLKAHAGFTALLARLRQDRDRWQKTL